MISSTVSPGWPAGAVRARDGEAGWFMAVPVARGAGSLPRLQVVLAAVLAVLARRRERDALGAGRDVVAAQHLDRPAPRVVRVVAVHVLVELGDVPRALLVGVGRRPRRVGLV